MIRVGQVVGVFGVQGAVKVLSLTDFDDRFRPGSELYLDGVPHSVEWSRPQAATVVVKLVGLDSRTTAQAQRGSYLEVPETHARRLPDGAWYHDQLLGLRVVTESGRELGSIAEVMERPANDVWVARRGGGETLIPATREMVRNVDLDARLVTVADWLIDLEEA